MSILKNVLYVEDQSEMAMIVSESLRFNGFSVTHCFDSIQALEYFKANQPDIVILDIVLQGISGIDLAKMLKQIAPQIPIIFVSAKTRIEDLTLGFETGANDYLRKPFMVEELILRIQALLRVSVSKDHYHFGEYELNFTRQHLVRGEAIRKLSYREAAILQLLTTDLGKVVNRSTLIGVTWPESPGFSGRSLDVFISRLRRYLKDDPRIRIQAVKKFGYKLAVDPWPGNEYAPDDQWKSVEKRDQNINLEK